MRVRTESHEGLSDLLQRSPFAATVCACTASHEGLLDLMQRSPFAAAAAVVAADESHGVTPCLLECAGSPLARNAVRIHHFCCHCSSWRHGGVVED